CPTGVCGG
ncbi:tail length tape measure family protein, partial [Escherichia coli 94.0618]